MVEPRIVVAGDGDASLGDRAVALAAKAGLILDDWQQLVLKAMLTLDRASRRFLHFEVGLNVARQNGKGGILEARELAGLFEDDLGPITDEDLLIHTAHEFATSQEHFRRVETLVDGCPELKTQVKLGRGGQVGKHSHGEESIELLNGKRLLFKTRTKSGMRGFAGVDFLALDEAMIIPSAAHGASMPIVRASDSPHGPQLVYSGSAVDQLVHEHGLVFARVRDRARAGEENGLAYFEWSAPAEHPVEVSESMAADHENWRLANPALGVRVSEEHMEREFRSMDPRTFAVELLGVGDWPDVDGAGDALITLEDWERIADEDATIDGPVVVAFDVSPDRRSSVVLVGVSDRGGLLIDVVDSLPGTSWVAATVQALSNSLDVVEFVCDGPPSPASSIAKTVEEEAGVTVRRLNIGEHGQACGRLVDAVDEASVSHRGNKDLESAVRGAKPRPLGDAWAWSRKSGAVDISPLVASTLGLWSALDRDLLALGSVAIF